MPGLLGRIEQYGRGFLDKWAPQHSQVGPYAPAIDRELAAKQANVDEYLRANPDQLPVTVAPAPARDITDILRDYIPRMRGSK